MGILNPRSFPDEITLPLYSMTTTQTSLGITFSFGCLIC